MLIALSCSVVFKFAFSSPHFPTPKPCNKCEMLLIPCTLELLNPNFNILILLPSDHTILRVLLGGI